MKDITKYKNELSENGFSILNNIYSAEEVHNILTAINNADTSKDTFRKSSGLFAIRQFFKELPDTIDLIFTQKLKSVIKEVLGSDFFCC